MILRLIALVSILACSARAAPLGSAGPPNVVIFIADDLSWHDVACFGGPTDAKTPHLDRLAREGLKFTGFFSPASVCSPTRQALLTGLYPVRSGAYPNHAVVRAGVRSLPHHLKPLGYRTATFGKTHYGPAAAFPFDLKVGMASGGAAAPKAGGEDAEAGFLDFPALERFIAADSRQPFCAYLASHEPHGPWNQGNSAAYDPAKLTLPPYLVDTPETRQALSAYYAEVSMLDDQVGTVESLGSLVTLRTQLGQDQFGIGQGLGATQADKANTGSRPGLDGGRRNHGFAHTSIVPAKPGFMSDPIF